MPVMVLGADGAVGGHAVRLLRAGGGEVRVFLDGSAADPAPFRDLGCKVAVGALDDEGHLETALEQVHTVLALLGRPTDDPDAYLERVATAVTAAIGAHCRRLVLLSDACVDDPRGNPWLAALVEAEDLAADAPMESVVLRCGLVYGRDDPLTVALAAGALGPAPAGSHWPVWAGDVATVAAMADAERDLDSSLHLVIDVAGPRQVSTADLAAALHEALPAAPGASLPPPAVDLLTRTVGRPQGALGGSGTPLERAW